MKRETSEQRDAPAGFALPPLQLLWCRQASPITMNGPAKVRRPMHLANALRTVAMMEAAKGMLVLLAGCGLLSLLHHDIQRIAEHLVHRAHLNPAAHYPHIFLDLAERLTDARLMLLAAGAACYAAVRLIEAYGLWYARRWAEWFAALSGGFYIPFEIYELYKHFNLLTVCTLTVNIAVVSFMFYCVLRTDGKAAATG